MMKEFCLAEWLMADEKAQSHLRLPERYEIGG